MPIYDFRCHPCQGRSSLFVRSVSASVDPVCPHCGSRELTRLISSFAYHKSEQTRLEEAGPPQLSASPDYYQDPRNIGRWAEKRLGEMGVDIDSEPFSEVQEMIGRARDGDMSILDKRG